MAVLEHAPKPAEELAYEKERFKPMPGYNHSIVQLRLGSQLLRYEKKFSIASELRLAMSPRQYTPDICILEPHRPDWTHEITAYPDPPVTVVEIISSTQGYDDISPKIDAYFEHGVKTVWLVHPELQTLTIYTGPTTQHLFHDEPAIDPVTNIEVDLKAVFI